MAQYCADADVTMKWACPRDAARRGATGLSVWDAVSLRSITHQHISLAPTRARTQARTHAHTIY